LIPADYSSFLVASSQASAALIGLLFVAVSIAPERIFGHGAEAERQALALSAFTALANAFFISFGSLIPDLPFGVLVVVAGGVAGSQTIALLALLPNWRRERTLVRSVALFGISAAIYVSEIVLGILLLDKPGDRGDLSQLAMLLLGVFSIGLARAWELLGAPHGRGAVSTIAGWLDRRVNEPDSKPPDTPKN
jgi:hypothetical protein